MLSHPTVHRCHPRSPKVGHWLQFHHTSLSNMDSVHQLLGTQEYSGNKQGNKLCQDIWLLQHRHWLHHIKINLGQLPCGVFEMVWDQECSQRHPSISMTILFVLAALSEVQLCWKIISNQNWRTMMHRKIKWVLFHSLIKSWGYKLNDSCNINTLKVNYWIWYNMI